MNMKDVYDVIQSLINTRGTNAKLEILQNNKDNPKLEEYLWSAYNPELNYYFSGLKTLPQRSAFDLNEPRWLTIQDLRDLRKKLTERELTGNAARDYVIDLYSKINDESIDLLQKMFKHDIRAGVSTTSINKVWVGLIPTYPYMRCNLLANVDVSGWGWKDGMVVIQKKYDGMFANVHYTTEEEIVITSRNGTPFPIDALALLDIGNEVERACEPGTVLHGELVVMQNNKVLPRQTGNGLLNTLLQEGQIDESCTVVFHVWDLIDEIAWNMRISDEIYRDRFNEVLNRFSEGKCVIPAEHKVVGSLATAMRIYQEYLKEGEEGGVIKNMNGIWKHGTSDDQLKLKLEVVVDLKPVALNPGNGKNAKTFGSIKCVSADGVLETNVSGMTDKVRQWIFDNQDEFFTRIVAVKSNTLLAPTVDNDKYSLFLPRLEEIRLDKDEADTIEQVKQQFDNAINEVINEFISL